MDILEEYRTWYKENEESIWKGFFEYLRFKSISAHPEQKQEMRNCAQFLIDVIEHIGCEAKLIETSKAPFIFAHKAASRIEAPTLLIYLHYDVQPVDPIELWQSDPFEPEIRDHKVYARGACDNKGQGFYTLMALKAFLAFNKNLHFNLKIVIEGGEETGSTGLIEALPKHKDLFQADYLLIVDSGLESLNHPAITLGMRGIACFELTCCIAKNDLHSGEWGGIAANSLQVLVNALASLKDAKGNICIKGFYDDVDEPTEKERSIFLKDDLNQNELKKVNGICAFNPEPGKSLRESGWMRPTLEINGLIGGYTEEGFKTVIPAQAMAKLSFRTVPHQTGERIETLLKEHLQDVFPQDVSWSLRGFGFGKYLRSNLNSPIVSIAKQAYSEVFNKPCQLRMLGGTVPVAADLGAIAHAQTLAIGTGTSDNQYHAPNEFFYMESFEKGFLTIVRIFDILQKDQM